MRLFLCGLGVIEDEIRVRLFGLLFNSLVEVLAFRIACSTIFLIGDCFEEITFDNSGLFLAEPECVGDHLFGLGVEQGFGIEGQRLSTIGEIMDLAGKKKLVKGFVILVGESTLFDFT